MTSAMKRGSGVLFLCAGSLLACDSLPTSAEVPVTPPSSTSSERDASRPFYAGVYLGDASTTPERVQGAIAEYTRMAGSAPAWVKSFHNLDADLTSGGWAGRVLHGIAATGATNFVALDLTWGGRTGSLLDAINTGAADAQLRRVARSLAQVPGTVLLEPGWEMNGNWAYAWQGIANGQTSGPGKFVQAWRRTVEIFREEGARNVHWVFNPNTGNALAAGSPGASHWNWWGNYYPGDDYVDYVGAHGYNGPSVWGHQYKSFHDVFFGRDSDNILDEMARRYPGKPIIIGEVATEDGGSGKASWIRSAYAEMLNHPNVVGAVWFDMKKEADWRIASSAESAQAYREVLGHRAVATVYRAPGAMVAMK